MQGTKNISVAEFLSCLRSKQRNTSYTSACHCAPSYLNCGLFTLRPLWYCHCMFSTFTQIRNMVFSWGLLVNRSKKRWGRPLERHDGVWGSGGIVALLLNFGTRWRWAVGFMHVPLYPRGKYQWYPCIKRLADSPSRSGHFGEENSLFSLPEIETGLFCCPVGNRHIPTTLSGLPREQVGYSHKS